MIKAESGGIAAAGIVSGYQLLGLMRTNVAAVWQVSSIFQTLDGFEIDRYLQKKCCLTKKKTVPFVAFVFKIGEKS